MTNEARETPPQCALCGAFTVVVDCENGCWRCNNCGTGGNAQSCPKDHTF